MVRMGLNDVNDITLINYILNYNKPHITTISSVFI